MKEAPRIWTRRPTIIEPRNEIVIPACIRGRYRLERYNRHGQLRGQTPWISNLITNAGLDRLGTGNNPSSTFVVGTGNAPPTVFDTALESLVASATSSQASSSSKDPSPPYSMTKTITRRFGQGDAAGNLAEVGIGWGATSLFSRALIVDEQGEPTTFTVGADEFLDVTYQIEVFPPLDDVEDEIDISGTPYDIVLRPRNITSSSASGWNISELSSGLIVVTPHSASNTHAARAGDIAPITGDPSSPTSAASSVSIDSYVDGTYQRSYTLSWGLGSGNFDDGIASVVTRAGAGADYSMNYQCGYTPKIPKDSTKVLALAFTHAWTRAE